MKRFAALVLKRLLVSVAVLLVVAGFVSLRLLCRSVENLILLCRLVWPWALSHLFVVVHSSSLLGGIMGLST
jgi:hypothetical protein